MWKYVFLSFDKKKSSNHKNLTPNQYNDTFRVQNELSILNFHLRIGFCKFGKNLWLFITVKNHEKYRKTMFFDNNQKSTTNY